MTGNATSNRAAKCEHRWRLVMYDGDHGVYRCLDCEQTRYIPVLTKSAER